MKEIDELEAGPELNRLVCNAVGIEGYQLEYGKAYPDVSGRIELAFQVLEYWQGDYILRRRNDTAFSCELFQPSQEFLAWASTLPLAICRAALKASGKGE